MVGLSRLCEEIRSELSLGEASSGDSVIDTEGWKGCFQRSVFSYSRKTGLPVDGLWSAVEAVVSGQNPIKVLKKLQKSWGGSPEDWIRWFEIAKQRPDC